MRKEKRKKMSEKRDGQGERTGKRKEVNENERAREKGDRTMTQNKDNELRKMKRGTRKVKGERERK